jgi:hypothetical protein
MGALRAKWVAAKNEAAKWNKDWDKNVKFKKDLGPEFDAWEAKVEQYGKTKPADQKQLTEIAKQAGNLKDIIKLYWFDVKQIPNVVLQRVQRETLMKVLDDLSRDVTTKTPHA